MPNSDTQGQYQIISSEKGHLELQLSGDWIIGNVLPTVNDVKDNLQQYPDISHFVISSTGLGDWDSRLVSFILILTESLDDNHIELDPALQDMSEQKHQPRQFIDEYQLEDGRRIRLLAEGRLVNLAAAEGHPATVMDMSFANQALSIVHLWKNSESLENKVYPVPGSIDDKVAVMKLAAMEVSIDTLTQEQQAYLASWKEGT